MEEPDLTLDQLDALTAEVNVDTGPGSPGWAGEQSHTQRFNAAVIEAFRAHDGVVPGELEDVPILLLSVRGAKSGKVRTVPLGCWVFEGRLLTIASMGGADRNPPWYFNVRANPECTVEWQGETFAARAVIHKGAERDRLFSAVVRIMPVFGEYQTRTQRVLPVVEFVRLDER